MSKRKITRICYWCRRVIAEGAPAMHTNVVDIASLNGRTVPVVSQSRSFHIKEPDCYKESLYQQHQASAHQASADVASTKEVVRAPEVVTAAEIAEGDAVGDEVYAWGEAFGITAEEVLSGERERVPKVRSPYALRLRRENRALTKR